MAEWSPPNPQYPPPKPGEPPLHRAARLGDHDAIRKLVEEGADINAVFDIRLDPGARPMETTPLMVAAGSGDGASVETVRLLLSLGADAVIAINGASAAAFAAQGLGWNYRRGGDIARLTTLVEAGSPLPSEPLRANRVLCRTAAIGDPARLAFLLRHGLNPSGEWDAGVALKRAEESVRRMREHKPAGTIPEHLRASLEAGRRKVEQDMIASMTSAPSPFEIPLFCAAESGSAECVELLLRAGANPHAVDSLGRTAMHSGTTRAVALALSRAGLSLEHPDNHGNTPLGNAVRQILGTQYRELLAAGANPNMSHAGRYTPFMAAVNAGRPRCVLQELVMAGADPKAVVQSGVNAFHAVFDQRFEKERFAEILGYLHSVGADIEHRNDDDQTPLAAAIMHGCPEHVEVLCELGANPNAVCRIYVFRDEPRSNPNLPLLFHAADGPCPYRDRKTEALLRAGADPRATDGDGRTALELAVGCICKDAQDPAAALSMFFGNLPKPTLSAASREDFISGVAPALRRYVDSFAASIAMPPGDSDAARARERRQEYLNSIVWLAAHGQWAEGRTPGLLE